MSILCPSCSNPLDDEYGMTTCSKCRSVIFIDMDGQANISEESSPEQNEIGSQNSDTNTFQLNSDEPQEGTSIRIGSEDPTFESHRPIEDSAPVASDLSPVDPYQSPLDFFQNETLERDQSDPVLPLGPAEDPLGIKDFANSSDSAANEGLLRYNVSIQGIDTKEIRDSIREVIADPRLVLPYERLMHEMRQGELKIGGLSPIKASVIVSRCRRFGVKIKWEQYAINTAPENQNSPDKGDAI